MAEQEEGEVGGGGGGGSSGEEEEATASGDVDDPCLHMHSRASLPSILF